jgi:hypothetical protein
MKSKKKIPKKEVAKIVKSKSRKHQLPPNKREEPKTTYKRDKKIDLEE